MKAPSTTTAETSITEVLSTKTDASLQGKRSSVSSTSQKAAAGLPAASWRKIRVSHERCNTGSVRQCSTTKSGDGVHSKENPSCHDASLWRLHGKLSMIS